MELVILFCFFWLLHNINFRIFGSILLNFIYYKYVSCLFKVDRHVDLLEVAQETDGFSGSDLKEMCRDAALLCVREYVNSASEER